MTISFVPRTLLTFSLIFFAASSFAGELLLSNGDRLLGQLVSVDEDQVVWASDSFGEVTVDKALVAQLQTENQVSVEDIEESCLITGVEAQNISFSCADGSLLSLSLDEVDSILPYTSGVLDESSYSGKIALGILVSRGNTVKDEFEADSAVTYRDGDFRHVMDVYLESKSQNNGTVENKHSIGYRNDWFFSERGFWYNQARTGADDAKRIDRSFVLGSGAGFQIWDEDDLALALEAGLDYEKEKLIPDPLGQSVDLERDRERTGVRLGTNFMYQLPLDARFVQVSEFLSSFNRPGDWRFNSESIITIPLGAGLFSDYKLEYKYDNKPPAGTRKKDVKVSVGLGYEW